MKTVLLQLKIGGNRKVSLMRDELDYFMDEGLIEMVSHQDYMMHDKSTLHVSFLGKELNAARDDRQNIIRDRAKLLKKHESLWHRMFTSRKRLDEEAERLKWSAGRIDEISEDIKRIEKEIDGIDLTKEYLASFVRTPYGYMRLSRKGEEMLKRMSESDSVRRN